MQYRQSSAIGPETHHVLPTGIYLFNIHQQVGSLIEYPDLLKPECRSIVSQLYPSDAIERAITMLKDMGGSSGAYSHSQGIPAIRQHVAESIASTFLARLDVLL